MSEYKKRVLVNKLITNSKEENNPNTFINVQDSECNSILSKAQQLLKSNIAFNSSKSFFTTRSSIDSHILSTTSIEFLK